MRQDPGRAEAKVMYEDVVVGTVAAGEVLGPRTEDDRATVVRDPCARDGVGRRPATQAGVGDPAARAPEVAHDEDVPALVEHVVRVWRERQHGLDVATGAPDADDAGRPPQPVVHVDVAEAIAVTRRKPRARVERDVAPVPGDCRSLRAGPALATGGADADADGPVGRPVVGEDVGVAVRVAENEIARVRLEGHIAVVRDVRTAARIVRHPTRAVVARPARQPAAQVAHENVRPRVPARAGPGNAGVPVRPGQVRGGRAPRHEASVRRDRWLPVGQVARLAPRAEAHHARPSAPPVA